MWNPFNYLYRRMVLWQMAKFFARVDRNPVQRTPSLDFEELEFQTEDGVTLKAWYLPAAKDTQENKIVVFNHFMLGNRAGAVPHPNWGNVAVDFMPIYEALVNAGYSVFTYDLRNHGESDVVDNGKLGLTHTEYKDVLAAVRYVKEHYKGMDTYLYSQCYGAVATMRAMEQSPEDFADIKAFVSIQPLSADAFVTGVTKELGLSDPSNIQVFSDHLLSYTGYTVDQNKVPALAPAVKVPTLLVQVEKDFRTTQEDIQAVYDQLGSDSKKLLWITDVTERLEGYNYFGRKPEELVEFLKSQS